MPLIEGVGDEVVQFVGGVLVVVIAALAWWSTNARPDRYRTVLVMRSRTHHPVTVSIRTRPNFARPRLQENNSTQAAADSLVSPTETRDIIPLQEMDSIVDADMAMLDDHRLHFYRRLDSPTTTQSTAEPSSEEVDNQEESEPASTAQIREMDSIVNAMEADVSNTRECFSQQPNLMPLTVESKAKNEDNKVENTPSASNTNNRENISDPAAGDQGTSGNAESNAKKILIKLKYLNDTLKEVEGSLDELLKDFKWRHFSSELSRSCRVRLIFNGRVLAEDATLRALGLHHRAVVHALVHPHRPPTQGGNVVEETGANMGATHELVTEEAAGPERTWDLENILMTLVSIALTVVWFFRCEYSNMFTASASVALFGLTVFYSVAIVGLYLSDTFHIDRRAPAPAPALAPASASAPASAPPAAQPQPNN